jgi:hypothetical protein
VLKNENLGTGHLQSCGGIDPSFIPIGDYAVKRPARLHCAAARTKVNPDLKRRN